MATHPLDHGRVADAEAEDEAIIIEAGQGAQAASGGERVASVDIRDGAADDEPGRVRQHEAGDGEGFISESFRVPERRVAEVFNRSQQASDPGSVQTVDRIPDAQPSQLPHHSNSPNAPLNSRHPVPDWIASAVEMQHHRDTTSFAVRLQRDADACRTASKVIAMGDSSDDALFIRLEQAPLAELIDAAGRLRDEGHGRHISYSRKVFIPLTHLCRDVCHYCTFAERPRAGRSAYLSPDEVLAIARAGAAAGCTEALFTLGDKPELRYRAARDALDALGYETTIDYLQAMCALVLRETGLLPHANPGIMSRSEMAGLRTVSASQGIMLESLSARLCEPGGVHYGSPDKRPEARLETLRLAGELRVPFTTGILIGIGETRAERLEALFAIRDLHRRFGHVQEVIVQNFRAKPGTKLAGAAEPDLDDLLWSIAAARLILGPTMNIQAPPNLSPGVYPRLIAAGINDWGGISPVTPDHVNPEAPWPAITELAERTAAAGKLLVHRLPIYPSYARDLATWSAPEIATQVRRLSDAEGLARDDDWAPGTRVAPRMPAIHARSVDPAIERIIERAHAGARLDAPEIVRLFAARDADYRRVVAAADELRRATSGDIVRYVVNRNINYTNICYYRCQFCAFSKGKTHEALRGAPYDLALEEIVRRATEAWERGATEVCLQGGIHPDYTGETYLGICRAIKAAVPDMHIHAFSPLEVTQGAATLGCQSGRFWRSSRPPA